MATALANEVEVHYLDSGIKQIFQFNRHFGIGDQREVVRVDLSSQILVI